MKLKKKIIQSWMGVFKRSATVIDVETHGELADLIDQAEPFKIVGKFHSYNECALADRVVRLGSEFNYIWMNKDQSVTVGAACTIKQVMMFLLDYNRRLINSGNHREQTLVGAILTGTHGFGRNATMADTIQSWRGIDRSGIGERHFNPISKNHIITEVTIETAPLVQYAVRNCVCRLSEVASGQVKSSRAYAVLPYSSEVDPVAVVAEYSELEQLMTSGRKREPGKKTGSKFSWWRLKAWWTIDRIFPPLRKWIQRSINFFRLKEWIMITDERDIDALYHPWPTTDGKRSAKFLLWAYKPTYTCFNTALFVSPEDTERFIKYAIAMGEKIQPGLFRCFIGVRELTNNSRHIFAGNFEGPCNAIDFYCSPKHAGHLIELQRILQDRFQCRPHHGKTVE